MSLINFRKVPHTSNSRRALNKLLKVPKDDLDKEEMTKVLNLVEPLLSDWQQDMVREWRILVS